MTLNPVAPDFICKFQFLKGVIKWQRSISRNRAFIRFNSLKVRLNAVKIAAAALVLIMFQFLKGAIK